MLVTMNEVLQDARKNKYAVGLFNAVTLELAQGIIAAAEQSLGQGILVIIDGHKNDRHEVLIADGSAKVKAVTICQIDVQQA